MATPFSYANTITAGTPIVAAEVQDNFDDIADHLATYYQQTADTTAEIAAAIAANPSVEVLGFETQTGVPASFAQSTNTDVPGLSITFTADPTHLYRYSFGGLIACLTSNTGTYRTIGAFYNGSTTYSFSLAWHNNTTWGSGSSYITAGQVIETGISGSTTVKVQASWTSSVAGSTMDLLNSGTLAQFMVEDLGVAP